MRLQASFPRRPARSRLMAVLLAGAAVAAAPVTIDLAPGKGPVLSAAFAQARGSDDNGGRGRGGDDNGGRGGDDHGGRGRGGDDGPGDDHGGRGRGGDDRGRDDHGGRDRGRGADDAAPGADRGRGRGRDDGRKAAEAPGRPGKPSDAVPARYERSARGIEVTYADGWREEVENGRYELKDARNRTVAERPATRQDYDRLGSIGR